MSADGTTQPEQSKLLIPLGKMTVFYVPSYKLDDARFFGDAKNVAVTARSTIHSFLVEHFSAYTHTPTPVKGFWTDHDKTLQHDVLERFEVSFADENQFEQIVAFLVKLAETLNEDSIYVTRGDRSYLVRK